jgi:hypothetical protein
LAGTLFPITARYRLPLVYLLMPMAAYGLVGLVRLLTPPVTWRRALRPVGLLGVLAVFCNTNVFGLQPAHAEYLPFHFAAACIATGQHDLMVETSDEIQRILADPSRAKRIPPHGMTRMFQYFYDRRDLDRAVIYGREMIRRRESADAKTLGALTNVFIQLGHRPEAERTLAAVENITAGQLSGHLALALMRYGRAYRDRHALTQARRMYTELVRLHPAEKKYRNGLRVTQEALAAPTTSRQTETSAPGG